jgi:cell division protein FtsA
MAKTGVVAGLDIGNSKVIAFVARAGRPGVITGVGKSASLGMRKGMIYDPQLLASSISRAVEEASNIAGAKIQSVCAGIAGCDVRVITSQSRVSLKKNRQVKKRDIDNLLWHASQVGISDGYQVIQVIPKEFVIDDVLPVKDPVGMICSCLETKIKIVIVNNELIKNLILSLELAGLKVEKVALNLLVAAGEVLGEVEKELGVALVDLGGSTTGVGVFNRGGLVEMAVLPVGGEHITGDLAVGLKTSLTNAELLKRRVGLAGGEEQDREISAMTIQIIRARVEEILALVKEQVFKFTNGSTLPCGLILTGGGALLKEITEMSGRYFNLPARVGVPEAGTVGEIDSNPAWSAGVGLIRYGEGFTKRGGSNARL